MSEDGWGENPYPRGSLQWYWWEHHVGPIIRLIEIQVIIDEKGLEKVIGKGWAVVTQLQNSKIIVSKQYSSKEIVEAGMKELKISDVSLSAVMEAGMRVMSAKAKEGIT